MVMSVLRAASLMSAVYEEMRDKDGFLYIKYSGENTFGCDLGEDVLSGDAAEDTFEFGLVALQ